MNILDTTIVIQISIWKSFVVLYKIINKCWGKYIILYSLKNYVHQKLIISYQKNMMTKWTTIILLFFIKLETFLCNCTHYSMGGCSEPISTANFSGIYSRIPLRLSNCVSSQSNLIGSQQTCNAIWLVEFTKTKPDWLWY